MKALVLNCALKPSPQTFNTEALARVLMQALGKHRVESEILRVLGRPIAYNRVAGFVVTGNEDGAHHVINEMTGALLDIGFTVPGVASALHERPTPAPR